MDASEQLRQDFRDGHISVDRLFDIIATVQRQLASLQQENEELKKKLGVPATAKCAEPFSVKAEEERQQRRGNKKKSRPRSGRRGRRKSADKLQFAERTENCYPQGVPAEECWFSHARPVWRLEKGRALLIAYHIYRGPKNHYGQIPGVLGRSEMGLEIVVQIAYLVYVQGLSLDKVCQTLQFLQHVPLGKSQADTLLRRLARHWQHEFDVLCTLLANSLVVHADETSWSINSVWAFLSEKARLLFFGVPKDAETLQHILDPQTFAGLIISDDAAVYAGFSQAQKCWAHLLRKAIKLTLQDPSHTEYRQFTDDLLAIYRQACRVQRDGRLKDAGRLHKIAELEGDIVLLCAAKSALDLRTVRGLAKDYGLLVKEVMRLLYREELFTFVKTPAATPPNADSQPVAGTNNEAERTLRNPAMARKTGRTNKTIVGARRQTIVVSVLESLRLYLPKFTLSAVLGELERWLQAGESCFTRLLKQMKLRCSASILDKVLAIPDG